MYCKKRRNKVYHTRHVKIKAKRLGQIFEERRRGRPADVFNIIQKIPNIVVVYLKIDKEMESRRSYKEVRRM